MLKKKNRLLRISKTKNEKVFTSALFKVRISESGEKNSKFGFVVAKKVSKSAVVRNRTKRVLKKAARELLQNMVSGKNIMIVARKELDFKKEKEAFDTLFEFFKKANITK